MLYHPVKVPSLSFTLLLDFPSVHCAQSLLHSSLEFPPKPETDSKSSESESFMASNRIAITFLITSSKLSAEFDGFLEALMNLSPSHLRLLLDHAVLHGYSIQ